MAGKSKSPKKGAAKGSRAETMKTMKDEVGALVTRPMDGLAQTFEKGMPRAKVLVADMLQQLAALAALKDVTPVQLADLHDYISTNLTGEKSAVAETANIVRARALEKVIALADERTENGTLKWHMPDGRIKEARIQRTGYDPKLVEAAIRARQLNPKLFMQENISYSLASDTIDRLEKELVFTKDELEGFKYKPSYALQKSKLAKDGEP